MDYGEYMGNPDKAVFLASGSRGAVGEGRENPPVGCGSTWQPAASTTGEVLSWGEWTLCSMPTLPTGESWLCFGINGLAEARCTYLVSEKTGPKAQRTGLEIDWGKEVFFVDPKIIERGELLIAGVSGDGSRTADLWQEYSELEKKVGVKNKASKGGYEVRIYHPDGRCLCHVGVCVTDEEVDSAFTLLRLPPSNYAVFDVYVSQCYDSRNRDMDRWIDENRDRYGERRLDGGHYVVEYYGERFKGHSEDSIVEIWVPIVPIG